MVSYYIVVSRYMTPELLVGRSMDQLLVAGVGMGADIGGLSPVSVGARSACRLRVVLATS